MVERNEELKDVTYEIFIGILSLLSIVNIVLYYLIPSDDVSAVIAIMDGMLSLVFLSDFTFRLLTAESKQYYFFRQFGWADLLASLPFPQLKLLRLFRVVRAGRMLRAYGPVGIFKEFVSNRASSTLLSLLLLVFLLLEFGSMTVLAVEQYAPDANIVSGGDAVWYTFVTITTVGYGDLFPVTSGGRIFGMLIMAIGVGVFGTLTGYLSNFFLSGEAAISQAELSTETEAETPMAEGDAIPKLDAETGAGALAENGDARTKLAELKRLLAEQQASQTVLAQKITEMETLL